MSTTIPSTRPLHGLDPTSVAGPMFLFGSLMDSDLLAAVIERSTDHVQLEEAEVLGFRRRCAEGEVFPILVPQPDDLGSDAVVPGCLARGLTNADLDRILFFEGEGYALRPLTVFSRDTRPEARRSRRTTARAFLSTGLHKDSGTTWHYDHWIERHKPLALMLTDELMTHYGVTPVEDITETLWSDIKARCQASLGNETGLAFNRTFLS